LQTPETLAATFFKLKISFMNSRRQFLEKTSLGILSSCLVPSLAFAETPTDFEGLLVN